GKNAKPKNILLAACRAVGTFLLVFCMMHTTMISVMGLNNYRWRLPYFNLPAYIICLTLGAVYWIGEDAVRRRSYFISTIVSVVVILPRTAFMIPSYVSMPLLRAIISTLLVLFFVLFVIQKFRLKKPTRQQTDRSEQKPLPSNEVALRRQLIRILCMLSICCVLFENWQCAIENAYLFIINQELVFSVFELSPFPLSILSAILLARFIKAEFVQRDVPKPEATELG
ncbi:MAG: hypothetical protein R2912_09745, partial [Eubacteriales bacterium]